MKDLSLHIVNRFGLLTFALVAVTFNLNSVLADGVIRDGLGAISSGRGGANIGHSDNGQILLDNPAAMVNINVSFSHRF